MDERFMMHRLYATRLAAIVGAVLLAGWYFYLFITKNEIHYEIIFILAAMVVTKFAAMLYYRKKD